MSANKRRLLVAVTAIGVSIAACSPVDDASSTSAWGSQAQIYFQTLSDAYAREDFYGVLDFYSGAAEVEVLKQSFDGGPVVDMLSIGPIQARELLSVHLGADEAITLIWWPRLERYAASVTTVDDGAISHEIVAADASSTRTMLQARPEVVDWYQGFYVAYARSWTNGTPEEVSGLYAPNARLSEALTDTVVSGAGPIAALARESNEAWKPVALSALPGARAEEGEPDALFLAVTDFGQVPELAIGVFSVDQPDGCPQQKVVSWTMANGVITDERRYPEVETFRQCHEGELPIGWWTGIQLPVPREDVVTHTIEINGGKLDVRNGTDALVELVEWGLERFRLSGLAQPHVDSVTFEPTRQCDGVSGKVIEENNKRDLFLCLRDGDLFGNCDTCETPVLAARLGTVHELAHAWMLDNTDESTQAQLLAISGRRMWSNASLPWRERGVEYAAETIAWGLLDERIRLVRIGNPSCEELTNALVVLTGSTPLSGLDECGD